MRKTKNIFINLLGAALLAAGSAGTALAQTQRIWIGGGADLASEAGNWLNGIPVAGDGILMDASFIPNPNLIWDLGPSVPLTSVTIQGALPSGAFMVGSPLVVSGDITLNSPNTAILFNPSGAGSVLSGLVTVDAGVFSVNASTLTAVGPVTVNGGTFDLASAYFMGSMVNIGSGGTLSLRFADPDFNPEPPVLTSTDTAAALDLIVDGTVNVSSSVLGRLWDKGINFGAAASFVNFSNVLFQGPLLPGTTAIYFEGGAPSANFSNVGFTDGNIYSNVNAGLLGSGSYINMIGAYGPKTGDAFENDPSGYVQWDAPAAGLNNLEAEAGSSLDNVGLSWTYPQHIPAGHYIVRYSTDPADLTDPNSVDNQTVTPISAISANDTDSASFYELPVVTEGLRVFPQYFSVWLFNGTSTSTASNLVRNLYFPSASVADQDAAVVTRAGMQVEPESGPRFARGPAGAYSAFSFRSGPDQLITLNTPYGASHFYYDPSAEVALKDLAADQDGNTYGFIQKSTDTPMVVKFGADGSVLWMRTFITAATETAKALAYGNNAVYAATEYENGSNGRDYKIRKLSAADGTGSLEAAYDSSPGNNSYDEVNSLAFAPDALLFSGGYIYAAGASGMYPMSGRLHKFTDTGSAIVPSAAGTWPAQYSAPGGDSRALVVKEDVNGDLLVAGSEQRYDLNQGLNIWLNRYSPFGGITLSARYNNSQSNSDDSPTGLDFDNFGNIYVSGYTDMWNVSQGYNMLLAKFAPGGQFLSARVYDSGSGSYDWGLAVQVSTDNYAHVAGSFGGAFGVYSMPLGSANAQFFTAAEGAYTATADLTWNYTGQLPAGSTFYVQYSTDLAPAWNRASAQVVVSTGPLFAGTVQSRRVGELTALRYPGAGGGTTALETRGNLYKFKVWITSGGLTTELPEAQSFAKTPSAYDNTQYYGRERLSYMSGQSGPASAISIDGPLVYQAFGGIADGGSAGFGLRKYNTDQYLDWTKFFNHRQNRGYYVGNMARDAAGNFYLVGSQGAVLFTPEYESVKNIWIAKLDPAGDLVWSYAVDASGVNRMDELYDAALEGNFLYVTGVSSTSANGMDILARKYDISPSTYPALVWTYTENGGGNGDDSGYGIAVGTGAVYLSGTVLNTDKDMIMRALDKTTGLAAGAPIAINSGNGDDEGFDLALTTTTPASVYVAGLAAAAGTAGEGANAAGPAWTTLSPLSR